MTRTLPLPIDRRRHARTQLQLTLRSIRLDHDCGDVVDCLHMQNISRSGLGALSDRPFYPGQRIVLNLPFSPSSPRKNVQARVVRCQAHRQAYQVGLEFETFSVGAWNTTGQVTTIAAA